MERPQRKLLYSERLRMAETGSLGDFIHDEVPGGLRMAILSIIARCARHGAVGKKFENYLEIECSERLGWPPHTEPADFVERADVESFLDFIEVLVDSAITEFTYSRPGPVSSYSRPRYEQYAAMPQIEERLNELFDIHRFGYRLEDGEIRRIASPALDEVVVGPTLLAVQRSGWDEVERSYREAIDHQRAGADERDDALTAANAALEAALKAVGMKGNTLGALAQDFKRSEWVPPQLTGVPEALDNLLKRSAALRNIHGDAHGKAPGAEHVPQALANLAIHWAGAFISFLAEIAPDTPA